jgi:hypothetical protein
MAQWPRGGSILGGEVAPCSPPDCNAAVRVRIRSLHRSWHIVICRSPDGLPPRTGQCLGPATQGGWRYNKIKIKILVIKQRKKNIHEHEHENEHNRAVSMYMSESVFLLTLMCGFPLLVSTDKLQYFQVVDRKLSLHK